MWQSRTECVSYSLGDNLTCIHAYMYISSVAKMYMYIYMYYMYVTSVPHYVCEYTCTCTCIHVYMSVHYVRVADVSRDWRLCWVSGRLHGGVFQWELVSWE